MGWMKQIDELAEEIANILLVNPNSIDLGQVCGGWRADVQGQLEGEVKKDPIEAMKSLRDAARRV